MAVKKTSNNPSLGAIECEGCDGFATIRRRANGKRLLYTHCENCGMNQMSGAKIQAKWEKAIGESAGETPNINSEPVPDKSPVLADEWQPREVREQLEQINNETKTGANDNAANTDRNSGTGPTINNEQNSFSASHGRAGNGFTFGLFAGLTAIAAVAGLRR
jgi:hypothetical protein